MKKIVSFSVKHPVTTSMFTAALVLLGVLALFRLETALLPDISFPRLTVVTRFADESPAGIEKRVTKPVEEALSGVRGLIKVRSSSSEGISVVRLIFDWKADIDFSAMEVREKLDLIRNSLPQDAERPVVLKYDPNAAPLMTIACVPKDKNDRDLRRFIERNIKPFLRRVNGVGGVKISGGFMPEIKVSVDPGKLYAVQMTLQDVVQIISRANFNTPAGYLPEGNREVMVRTIGEFKHAHEIGNVIIPGKEGSASFKLSYLASIVSGYKDKKSDTMYNRTPCVGVALFAESGANQVSTSAGVKKAISKLQKKYANRVQFSVVVDRSLYISSAIQDVALAALIGGVLSFFVLLFFLRSLPEALVLAVSIPVCVAATLFLMFLSGITLNVISLGGLALGLGMTVDSGIVVVENIRKKMEKGVSAEKAVIDGTSEVAAPVFASILTSVAVFLPIVFVTGLSGRLFGQMALTVSFSLLVSIFTALSIIPTALRVILPGIQKRKMAKSRTLKKFKKPFWEKIGTYVEKGIRRRIWVVCAAVTVLLLAVPVYLLLDRGFLPAGSRKIVKANLNFPADMPLKQKKRIVLRFLKQSSALLPAARMFTEIGIDENDPTSAASSRNMSSAYVVIALDDQTKTDVAVNKMRSNFKGFSVPLTIEPDTTLIEGINAANDNSATVTISGDDKDVQKCSKRFKSLFSTLPYIENFSSPGMEKRDEVRVKIDRKKAASIGVAVRDIAAAVRLSLAGDVASKLKRDDRRIDIRVRFEDSYRRQVKDLSRIYLRTSGGALLPISGLASFDRGVTDSRLFREDGKRCRRYTLSMKKNFKDSSTLLSRVVKRFEKKYDVIASVGGKDEESDNLQGLLFAFGLAVVLVYMVLASQFESFFMPLLVMVSLPLSFIGTFVMLFLTGTSINVISSMGLVMLAGIAVNNAIVLQERFMLRINEGVRPEKAAVEAASSRVRPILMTTFTTLLGLLPLAVGGATLQRDLALAVVGGLISSTVLTLLFLPVFFSMAVRRSK